MRTASSRMPSFGYVFLNHPGSVVMTDPLDLRLTAKEYSHTVKKLWGNCLLNFKCEKVLPTALVRLFSTLNLRNQCLAGRERLEILC